MVISFSSNFFTSMFVRYWVFFSQKMGGIPVCYLCGALEMTYTKNFLSLIIIVT